MIKSRLRMKLAFQYYKAVQVVSLVATLHFLIISLVS